MYPSFLDELSKIAAAEKREGLTTGQKVVGTIGTAMGTNIGSQVLGGAVAQPLAASVKPSKAVMRKKQIRDLQKALSNSKAFNAANWTGSMMIPKGGMMPKFMRPLEEAAYGAAGVSSEAVRHGFAEGAVSAPLKHSPEFLAHELGHASLRDPKKSNVFLRTLMRARAPGIPLGILAGSALAMQDPDSTALKMAPVATAAGFAPTLIDEGLASKRGLGAIKGLGKYSPAAQKVMRKNLIKAFGTYGALAGAATGGIGLLSYLRSRKDK